MVTCCCKTQYMYFVDKYLFLSFGVACWAAVSCLLACLYPRSEFSPVWKRSCVLIGYNLRRCHIISLWFDFWIPANETRGVLKGTSKPGGGGGLPLSTPQSYKTSLPPQSSHSNWLTKSTFLHDKRYLLFDRTLFDSSSPSSWRL